MKPVYASLAVLGTFLPLSQFVAWIQAHGFDTALFIQQTAGSNLAAFAWLDVIISAVVLLCFIVYEGKQLNMKTLWIPILGTCTVGVSLGLPLFLLMREIKLQQQQV